jgi:hypothetical protein
MRYSQSKQPDGPMPEATSEVFLDDYEGDEHWRQLIRPCYGPDNEDAPAVFGNLSTEMWRRFKQGHFTKDIKLALTQYPAVTPEEIARGLNPKLTLSVVDWQQVEIVPAPSLVRSYRDRGWRLPRFAKVQLQTFLFDYEDDPDLCYSVWLKWQNGDPELFLEGRGPWFESGQNYEGLELPFCRRTGTVGLPMRHCLRIHGKDRHAYVQMEQQVSAYLKNKGENKQ